MKFKKERNSNEINSLYIYVQRNWKLFIFKIIENKII